MNQLERHYKIESLVLHRGVVGFAALIELQVSRSTLKRDLDYLRCRMNLPIEWDRDARGYRLGRSGEPRARAHRLPGLWFS